MCADHSILPQGQTVGRMTSLLHGGHVRLGINFMSWSNSCVLVWLSLLWRDFITSSDIRICGHVMSDVITLWWSRESWYDFFSVLEEIFVLVRFCLSWCHFTPWCNQLNLGMIFLRFGYSSPFSEIIFMLVSLDILVWFTASWYDFLHFARLFRRSVILFDLVSFYMLVRSTASWLDLCVLGINIFRALVFLFLHVDFHFYTCIYNVLHTDIISCCNVKKSCIKNIIFLV